MSSKLICFTILFSLISLVIAGKSGHGNIIIDGCHSKTILTGGGGKGKGEGNIILKDNCHHQGDRHVTYYYPVWGWHGAGWHGAGYPGYSGYSGYGGFGGF
uniref:Uncharacterized protein n=1 Tax=Tetranychus urticae TaxID=32264 RepID=T1L4T9_TETUR